LATGVTPHACQGCEIARYAVMGRLAFVGRVVRTGLRVLQDTEQASASPSQLNEACP
jgi:hypothetical protein